MRLWRAILCWAALPCAGAELTVLPDFLRTDPFGAIIETDRSGRQATKSRIELGTGRAGYVSCQLVAEVPETGDYRLEVGQFPARSGITVELYREWFHFVPQSKRHFPDALIPIPGNYQSRMPEPDNKIARQTVQAFWLDAWIPASAPPGVYEMRATLRAGSQRSAITVAVEVLPAIIPADDAVAMDHNTYGTSWFAEQYPALTGRAGPDFFASGEMFQLIQSYHRIFYEHRGMFHQLGYGHAGKVGPSWLRASKAPEVQSTSRIGRHSTATTARCSMDPHSRQRIGERGRSRSSTCRSTRSGPPHSCGGENRDTSVNLSTSCRRWNGIFARRVGRRHNSNSSSTTRSDTRGFRGTATKHASSTTIHISWSTRD